MSTLTQEHKDNLEWLSREILGFTKAIRDEAIKDYTDKAYILEKLNSIRYRLQASETIIKASDKEQSK